MTTYTTKEGVSRFETGGPDGLLTIEDGKTFETEDARIIAILDETGSHALDKHSDRASAGGSDQATREQEKTPAPRFEASKAGER